MSRRMVYPTGFIDFIPRSVSIGNEISTPACNAATRAEA
jgi:hypothetical protein